MCEAASKPSRAAKIWTNCEGSWRWPREPMRSLRAKKIVRSSAFSRLLKKDAAPPPTLRWWGGDCQAKPYVRQSGPPPTPRRWRRDWRLSAVEFKPLLAWKSCLHRHGVGGGRTLNHAIAGQSSLHQRRGGGGAASFFSRLLKAQLRTLRTIAQNVRLLRSLASACGTFLIKARYC